MSQDCTVCGRGTSDSWICPRCQDRTALDLRGLPAHALDLHTMLQRMTRTGTPNDGGKAADPALTWQRVGDQFLADVRRYLAENPVMMPFAQPAADLLHETRRLLVKWTRALRTMPDYPDKRTIPVLSAFLTEHLDDLFRREDVGSLTTALDDLTHRISRAVDLPTNRTTFRVGPCPQTVDDETGQHCDGDVWASFPQDSGWGQDATAASPSMRCKTCGMVWLGQHFNRVSRRILARQTIMDKAKAAELEKAS